MSAEMSPVPAPALSLHHLCFTIPQLSLSYRNPHEAVLGSDPRSSTHHPVWQQRLSGWWFDFHVCMLSCFSSVRQAPVHRILQARILEWGAMPSSRESSWPKDWTRLSCSSCIAGGFFTAEAPEKPWFNLEGCQLDQPMSVFKSKHTTEWKWVCGHPCPLAFQALPAHSWVASSATWTTSQRGLLTPVRPCVWGIKHQTPLLWDVWENWPQLCNNLPMNEVFLSNSFFKKMFIYLIHLWLHWVFVAVLRQVGATL